MIREKKTIEYKGFHLTACYTEKDSPVYVGTLYSKKFDKYRWKNSNYSYPKIVYEFGIYQTIDTMKKEVDKFLESYRKYLEWRIEETTIRFHKLNFDLNALDFESSPLEGV
jgi:hypothetical protein